MIRVQHLTKRYGSFVAVDDVSFDIEPGGVVGLLGPNGAGKTTTMRVLTCYHPASAGSVRVAGFDIFQHSIEVRRRIGYLPESTPLYPEMRVREYLRFRGKLRGLSRSESLDAIRHVTEHCWLGDFIDRPIGQLSKGMKQRVGLADAMLHEPDLLILDEPTIGLDPRQIRETRNLIKELGARHTVLLSSHILHEVEQTCTRTIIIADGHIVASGSPQDLLAQSLSQAPVVAELRGPKDDIEAGVRAIGGVESVDVSANNGWVKINIRPKTDVDVREEVFQLTTARGWPLRELHREGATLEDFFVKVTANKHHAEVDPPR